MPVKKALRMRKSVRARRAMHLATALRDGWVRTPRSLTATACVALAATFAFAYSASAPSVGGSDNRTAHAGAQLESTRAAIPAVARAQARAGDIALGADTGLRRTGAADDTRPLVVTLTGCLERSDKEFRLNETTGANAPKARSWKSGFLTKRSASVALVPAGAIPLANHVGRRVTVTGTLVDREMRVRALRRVAASCDDAPRVRA